MATCRHHRSLLGLTLGLKIHNSIMNLGSMHGYDLGKHLHMNHTAIPQALITALQQARHVVVFTGAGVSAESGVPTFRDAQTGLWERFDAEELATT